MKYSVGQKKVAGTSFEKTSVVALRNITKMYILIVNSRSSRKTRSIRSLKCDVTLKTRRENAFLVNFFTKNLSGGRLKHSIHSFATSPQVMDLKNESHLDRRDGKGMSCSEGHGDAWMYVLSTHRLRCENG